jgi:hypothetical protein
MLTTAGFNRRMRKIARPVVWKAHGAQSPWAHPISPSENDFAVHDFVKKAATPQTRS